MTYAALEPTDVIELVHGAVTHTLRITSISAEQPGVMKVEGVAEDAAAYDFSNSHAPVIVPPDLVNPPGETALEFLDLPALPSDDAEATNLRIAAHGVEAGWRGTVIYRSDDGGTNYTKLTNTDEPAIMGHATTALGHAMPQLIDHANSVTVIISGGTLESVNDLALLNGANAALLGNEIIQFKTATLLAQGKYELTGLLRGRLGTEHEVASHVAGERFILINSTLAKVAMADGLIGLSRSYKAVSIGNSLANTTALDFTYNARALKTYAPVHITGARDGADNLTISWVRRARIGGGWQDFVDVLLSEDSEAYEVDIMDGSTVVRTISGLSTPQATYSAADQTTDFGSAQSSVMVSIYQLSARVGRGVPATAAV